MSTTHNGKAVRCPYYATAPSLGDAVGCGSTNVRRETNGARSLAYECLNCGSLFGDSEVDADRRIAADPALRARQDARIKDGRYI
jgi:hypothetical protein